MTLYSLQTISLILSGLLLPVERSKDAGQNERNVMKKFQMMTLGAVLAISACANTTEMTAQPVPLTGAVERQAKQAAAYNLKDPTSAIYRGVAAFKLQNGDYVFCGEQNTRNSFGGLVGFKPFFVRFALGASTPDRKVELRGFFAQDACNALRQGLAIPIRNV